MDFPTDRSKPQLSHLESGVMVLSSLGGCGLNEILQAKHLCFQNPVHGTQWEPRRGSCNDQRSLVFQEAAVPEVSSAVCVRVTP